MSLARRNPALTGITTRHQKHCRSVGTELKCNCQPSYRAEVHNRATGRPFKSPSFKALADARSWRSSMLLALRNVAPGQALSPTVKEAVLTWLDQIERGEVRNRSGKSYKPSVIRSYETSLRLHVLPVLGARKLTNVSRRDLQDLAEQIGLAHSASTVRNAINPLRSIFRRAVSRGVIATSPAEGLLLPAVEAGRDRIATPHEARALLHALPTEDQALWATAFYAGLRQGEIRALMADRVDVLGKRIHVQHSWDPKQGLVAPKSKSGRRAVPIPDILEDYLVRHLEARSVNSGFVFGEAVGRPFRPGVVRRRALAAWKAHGLDPIGFHEARHTYASICIAAGVNPKSLSTYMGHSSIATTYDLYGHLFPGDGDASAAAIDSFLGPVDRVGATPIPTQSAFDLPD
jgi:integrase